MKYTTYEYNLSRFNTDDYSYIKLPYETSGKTKVLFVLDHMPSEDMKSGKLLSGVTGDLLNSLISATKKLYANTSASFSWLAVTFNAFRTYGTQAEFRASAEEAFARRLSKLICKYKPDYVVAFGTPSMRALLGDTLVEDDRGRVKFSYWLGVPVTKKFKSGEEIHAAKVVSNISLNDIVQGDSGEASLLGYMCKCLAPIFGKTYAIDSSTVLSKGVTYVDTFKKFERLMDILAEKEVVAIDTETKNLNKITNQLLTMQFAYNAEKAFLVPVAHKDSPFRPNEIKLIQGRMREYLEGANKNKYHIYANAKFDITLFRSECGVRYYANDIWDVLGGEFCFHPDTYVLTEAGQIRIQDLVRMDRPPQVLSYNTSSGILEYKPILAKSEHETAEDLYEIEYEGGTVRVTGNHRLWSATRSAYIRADEICPGEEVLVHDVPAP